MALKQHTDIHIRYEQQVDNSRSYVIPFIEKTHAIGEGANVLEIGCGEGGVLTPFAQRGCYCVGVDLDELRIDVAHQLLEKEIAEGKMTFLYKNVFDADFLDKYRGFFDVILLKDTIEHVPDQESFVPYLKNFLKPGGQIFFGFPPWYMPFGGHQQLCQKKFTSMLPYYHLLPRSVYTAFLKMMGENANTLKTLLEIYDTRISIERFERIVKKSGLKVLNKQHYFINPIYRFKFGLKPRKQLGLITHIPYFRDFVTTCVYYTVGR